MDDKRFFLFGTTNRLAIQSNPNPIQIQSNPTESNHAVHAHAHAHAVALARAHGVTFWFGPPLESNPTEMIPMLSLMPMPSASMVSRHATPRHYRRRRPSTAARKRPTPSTSTPRTRTETSTSRRRRPRRGTSRGTTRYGCTSRTWSCCFS